MKRKIALFLICLLLFNTCSMAFAEETGTQEITDETEITEEDIAEEETEEEESSCSTGALEMSAEELETFKENVPMIIDVKPNQLYYDRLVAETEGDGENIGLLGSIFNVTEDGEEIVTNFDDSVTLQNSVALENFETVAYPSKVDNSKEMTFPLIKDQGTINSCYGWSLAYYQLTNNANKIRGTTARNNSSNVSSRVYSPNWVHNLANDGKNSGISGKDATNVLYTYGCPTISQVPIATDMETSKNYLDWHPEEIIWENALYNKCDLYYGSINPDNLNTPITSPSSLYLDNIKRLLADGYVVTIKTKVDTNDMNYLPITKKGKTSTNTSAFVWTEVRETHKLQHAVTIVGYDDGFKVDINGDGVFSSGEYGAFKIANSWGTSVKNHNSGYVWLAYDALNLESSVKKTNNSERVSAITNNIYYFVKPQKEYKPLLTAAIKINTRSRSNLNLTLGIEDVENPKKYYEKSIASGSYITNDGNESSLTGTIAFDGSGGELSLIGASGKSAGYITVDFTSLLQKFEMKKNCAYNIYVKFYDSSYNRTTDLQAFTLKDHNTGETFSYDGPSVSTTNGTVARVDIQYISSINTVPKQKSFKLSFNAKINQATLNNDSVSITDSNNNSLAISTALIESGKKISLGKDGDLNNDYYTINILPQLKSVGGNSLVENVSYPFYVPFH